MGIKASYINILIQIIFVINIKDFFLINYVQNNT